MLAFLLFLPWFLNPSWGPSPIVLQTLLSAAAALVWFALPPAQRGHAAAVVAGSWLAGGSVNAAIALAQYFGQVQQSTVWISASAYGEAYGNLRQRNQLATLLALGLASAFYFAARARAWGRAGLVLAVVLMSAACALTSSRTGLLQWLLLSGLLIAAPWLGGRSGWRGWGLLALGSYLVSLLALPALAQWWTGESPTTLMGRMATDLGCVSRKVLWRNALTLIAERPWAGWGLGEMDYAHHVTLYPGERFCLILDNAHNLFLQVAVELGLPAALLLGALIAWGLWRGRPWAERSPGRLLAWAALAVMMLHSQVEYPLWYGPFELAALLAISLLLILPTVTGSATATATGNASASADLSAAPVPTGRPGALRLGLSALALAALAYVMWDYHRVSQLFLSEAARSPAYRGDTLAKVRGSWLFASQVEFAEFTTSPLTFANAAAMADLGESVMHYSPEPQVVQKLVEALALARRDERANWHITRFQVAFPEEYAAWKRTLDSGTGADLNADTESSAASAPAAGPTPDRTSGSAPAPAAGPAQ